LIGVAPGTTPSRAGLSAPVRAALAAGVNSTEAALPNIARTQVLALAKNHGGWATPAANTGDYGTDYTYRAGVAAIGLGANTPAEAVYPTAYTDGEGKLLDGAHNYRLVFARGHLPPVRAFWSLTLYGSHGFLVPNRTRRYAIGSTHPPLIRRHDGTVLVVISRRRPHQRGANWLPAPRGQFRLALRLYVPRAPVLGGTWQAPPVSKTS
jgi:hypothetical protein